MTRGDEAATRWYGGNAKVDAPERRGWLVGHFVRPEGDVRCTQDAEVKWGMHPAGDARAEWTRGDQRTTLTILVSGRFEVFTTQGDKLLDRQGDYVLWGPGVDHWWRALEDSVIVTVRWPSMPSG